METSFRMIPRATSKMIFSTFNLLLLGAKIAIEKIINGYL
jgi:hypothetical protein